MRHRMLALCAFISASALGSTVVDETIEELAKVSTAVVRATVRQSQSSWDVEHRHIWTYTELEITEPIKGKPGARILVKQPGGVVDGIGQAVSGTATFEAGEDVVLFLEAAVDERDIFIVRGLSAGKVKLTTVMGRPQAVRALDGLALVKPARIGVVGSPAQRQLGSPSEFLSRVRLAVKGVGL